MSSPSPSLRIEPLTSINRQGVSQLLFDTHMRSVPATFNFLKLRPMALILWTALSTAILKYRQTHLKSYTEVLTILAGSVILTHGVLFLTLLYEASTQAPGPDVIGKLEAFVDQDQDQASSTAAKVATGADTIQGSGSTSDVKVRAAAKKRSILLTSNKDNQFWVLEKNKEPIGSIGSVIDRSRGEAVLVSWAVREKHQRNGCGTLLLKTAMDQLSDSKKNEVKVQTVRVVLQGSQIPALRLFYKFGFKQMDRVPEWMGERVVLEMATKDWGKSN